MLLHLLHRIMGIMKSFVRNRRHPEASIAEGYIATECMTFCSRYLRDVETRFTRIERNYRVDQQHSEHVLLVFQIIGKPLRGCVVRESSPDERKKCHAYILNQCQEVQPFIE